MVGTQKLGAQVNITFTIQIDIANSLNAYWALSGLPFAAATAAAGTIGVI